MKRIIYISATLPATLYKTGLSSEQKYDQQSQKFNRAVMLGFIENGYEVFAISNRRNFKTDKHEIVEDNIHYYIVDERNHLKVALSCKKLINQLLHENPKSYVICDACLLAASFGAFLAARKRNCLGIVTDIPVVSEYGIKAILDMWLMKNVFSSYILLTEQMGEVVNPHRRPYCVMEGLYYGNTDKYIRDNIQNKQFIILYAGYLHKKYGIETLVKAVSLIKERNVELHLYGMGDYVDEIKLLGSNSNIVYHGVKDNNVVVEEERKADLLINPRSKNEMFTQYSFPSKTIEYMSTGTPVLMQELPGMPKEYKPYIYVYDGDTAEDLREAILKVMDCSIEERIKKANSAREFIIENKTAKMQVKKIIQQLKL